jgi:hypothetical protein
MQSYNVAAKPVRRRWLLLSAALATLTQADGRGFVQDAGKQAIDLPTKPSTPHECNVSAVSVVTYGAVGDGKTDDTSAIQSAIDSSSGRIVEFPRGVYLVSQLLLPDNTYLDLGSAVIRRHNNRDGGSASATIRNADFEHGNSRISVVGGTVEGGPNGTGRLINFVNCSFVRLSGATLSKGSSSFVDWMCVVQGCENVTITDLSIIGGRELGEDGLHIKASSRVVVQNCLIESGDDAIAIVQEYNQEKPIRDVSITNCVVSSAAAHMIRISVFPGESQGIDGVVLSNIVGRGFPLGSKGNPVLVNDETNLGLVRNVNISNVVINADRTAGDAWQMVNVRESSVKGVRITGASTRSFLLSGCSSVAFSDCHASPPRPANGNAAWTIADSNEISLTQCSATGAPIHSFEVAGSSSVQFHACRSVDPGADGIFLSGCNGVVVSGCILTGGVQGVHCDADVPPARVIVTGCVLTGQSDQPFKDPPLDSSYLGNIDRS